MGGVLLFVFLVPNAGPEAVKEFKRLDGTWEVVRQEQDGKAVEVKDSILPQKVQFTDMKPKGIEARCDIYTIGLDPKAEVPRLTATVAGGEIKGQRMLAIYQFGKESVTIRLSYGAKEFPQGFTTVSEDGTFLLELRRVKP